VQLTLPYYRAIVWLQSYTFSPAKVSTALALSPTSPAPSCYATDSYAVAGLLVACLITVSNTNTTSHECSRQSALARRTSSMQRAYDPACNRGPASNRDPACIRDPASISTFHFYPRLVSEARLVTGTRLLTEVLRYVVCMCLSLCSNNKSRKNINILHKQIVSTNSNKVTNIVNNS